MIRFHHHPISYCFLTALTALLSSTFSSLASPPGLATPPAPVTKNFKGILTSIGSTNLTVAKKKTGEARTFQLLPETVILKDNKSRGTLSDLHPGQRVQVQLSPDGSKALRVRIWNRKTKTPGTPHSHPEEAITCQTCRLYFDSLPFLGWHPRNGAFSLFITQPGA